MKKKILLVSALVVIAMSAMFVACSDKNEVKDGCDCTIRESDAAEIEHWSKNDMELQGVTTCGELAVVLRTHYAIGDMFAEVNCK